MSVTVDDNPIESRYEASIDGALVGVSQYELTPDTIVFLHTVVAQEYEGQGVGGAVQDNQHRTHRQLVPPVQVRPVRQ